MQITPFQARVPEPVLADLRERLQRTRWSDSLVDVGWRQGMDPAFLKRLCAYWERDYDWRQDEGRLNALPQFRAEGSDCGIHFVHLRSAREDATPLLLTNGWPSSIFEYLTVIPMLAEAGFHVVAPTHPGYGFSDRPIRSGMHVGRISELYCDLMATLGYQRFLAHGSDVGLGVVEQIRRLRPEHLLGAHFCNLYWMGDAPSDPSPAERAYLAEVDRWMKSESAYVQLQRSKPQTLSFSLNDSPAGMAAWIIEKFHAWTQGELEQVYGLSGLCANLTLYWVTETVGSAARQYAEQAEPGNAMPASTEVPVGVVVFPGEHMPVPRQLAARWVNLIRYAAPASGGHFPAWEVPELFVDELCEFRAEIAALVTPTGIEPVFQP